jgi:ATP-binding cassette subfamily B protein RaxB
VVSRFESLEAIQRTLTASFVEAIIDGLMAVVTLVMMLIYSWKLAAIVCGAAVLYGLLRLALYRPLRQAQEEQIVRVAKQQTNFLETVRGIQSVKLFNRQIQRQTLYQNLLVDNFNAGIRVQKLTILYKAFNGMLFGIENVAVVWLGATLVLDGGFSIGMLFAFTSYKQQFISRVVSFIEKGVELKMLGLHTERVADIALTESEPHEAPQLESIDSLPVCANIEVRNLSFRYSESEPWVLRNVNFKIEEGESVAMVGPSGCGKTTLLKVLLGLLPATEGEVLIGGTNLMRFGTQRYRDMLGTVMQEDQLFAGSIADNITFFDPQPDPERVEVCAQLAAVHHDIEMMPMRYNTLIGDMGTALSGGQKQRILLARALYKKPQILFLDEATSHLDVGREKLVNEAIRRLKLTRVIIAHRPETIASADRVITLGEEAHPFVVAQCAAA